jgi:hypothetical protein
MIKSSKGSVVVVVLVIILVLVLGAGGVLFWGYNNAKIDKTYAQKASSLVNDYEKKYTDDYFNQKINEKLTDDAKITAVKESLEQAKKDAQDSLNSLNATKSSKRVASVQRDAQDYFSITIKGIDNIIAYIDYLKTLAKVGTELEAVNAIGGEATTMEGAATQFETAKAGVDKAITELETASVPETMKDFNAAFKTELTKMSKAFGGMSTSLKANDMTQFLSYATELETISNDITKIESPTADISKNIISTEDKKKLDDIPGRLTAEASNLAAKKFTFSF